MSHLLISNPGEAPLEALTLMGATTKDPSDPATIGMFGTGIKYSVAALLRVRCFPIIYSGTTRLSWELRPIQIGSASHHEVLMRIGDRAPGSTGMTLAMGQRGWNGIGIALREFISNALDEVGGNPAGIRLEVTDAQPRAKSGETRVYIPWSEGQKGEEALQDFLRIWFLHWRKDIPGGPKTEGPIAKASPATPPFFYRRGVILRQWNQSDAKPSLFDYNFLSLDLDEARKASDWDLRYKAGKLLSQSPDAFTQTLRAIQDDPGKWWEEDLDSWCLSLSSGVADAAREVLGSRILASSPEAQAMATNKGIQALLLPQGWVSACESAGLPTTATALDSHAQLGRIPSAPTSLMIERVEFWQKVIVAASLSGPSDAPAIYSFSQHPNAPSRAWGYCIWQGPDAGIYLNEELGGELLDQTILEELCHWHSQDRDFTSGFQEWLLRLACRLTAELQTLGHPDRAR